MQEASERQGRRKSPTSRDRRGRAELAAGDRVRAPGPTPHSNLANGDRFTVAAVSSAQVDVALSSEAGSIEGIRHARSAAAYARVAGNPASPVRVNRA
jgi:hypothetical protein